MNPHSLYFCYSITGSDNVDSVHWFTWVLQSHQLLMHMSCFNYIAGWVRLIVIFFLLTQRWFRSIYSCLSQNKIANNGNTSTENHLKLITDKPLTYTCPENNWLGHYLKKYTCNYLLCFFQYLFVFIFFIYYLFTYYWYYLIWFFICFVFIL